MGESLNIDTTIAEIYAAKDRLTKYSVLTPMLESSAINKAVNGRVLIKAENLQRTGAFKFRGAFNAVSLLSAEERKAGIITYSSGNHGQAIACAAKIFKSPAIVIMPKDAPTIKRKGTEFYGAKIFEYNRNTESREDIGAKLASEQNLTLVRPYDEPAVIVGQGTIGLEIIDQCKQLSITPDILFIPTGGGGLMAGISLAINKTWPKTKIYAVEPYGWDDHFLSLKAGKRLPVKDPGSSSICDSLLAQIPGQITFPINRKLVSGGLSISEPAILNAMYIAFQNLKVVLEPGGAISLAAALSGSIDLSGKTIIVIASGGNVDREIFGKALAQGYTND